MPQFAYKGRNARGEAVDGVLDSATAASVADQLMAGGVTPVEIKPGRPAETGGDVDRSLFRPKVGPMDVLLFSRHLYTLLKAGVPIMSALGGLRDSATNAAFRELLADVQESLDAGRELSAALGRHAKVFTPFYVAMVRVGEMTGMLHEIFLRLFHYLDFERVMRDQVKAALRYPTFVVIAIAVAIVIVNIFVIPPFAKVYQGFNAKLPLMTELLIGFSGFMVTFWPVLLGFAVAMVMGFRAWTATVAGRLAWDEMKLRLPISGSILKKAALARFARSFSLSARSGVPIVQAMGLVAATVGNSYMGGKVERMREGIERGESVLRTAAASGIFTPVVLQMIAVGEESGALDDLMQEVADMYQREIEYDLKNLSAQIEPVLIIFLGVLVLILALGVFLPIWDLGRAAMGRPT
ncbi:MAG TPA: type II secretion system F family protein [Usitatibacteraceae bacterium]|nr:type II secretion system F family protein [Usitatibacteraceae bacterium]